MPTRKNFVALAIGTLLFLAPTVASAQFLPFSFGGRVISINYCANGAVQIDILPAGTFPISYVWMVPPATVSIPPAPPTYIGQQVLGVAMPTVIPCVGFGTRPPVWFGFQVIYGGASFGF
jgi:hypothetical protein